MMRRVLCLVSMCRWMLSSFGRVASSLVLVCGFLSCFIRVHFSIVLGYRLLLAILWVASGGCGSSLVTKCYSLLLSESLMVNQGLIW